MSKLRVQCFGISIDGYSAGPSQDLENPLGVRGLELMDAFFHTRVWRQMHGEDGGETGVDNRFLAKRKYIAVFRRIIKPRPLVARTRCR
jgi:hypothetical protein